MKKITTILGLLLISSTVFGGTFEHETTQKANAVFGLVKCDVETRQPGFGTCDEEIQGAKEARISDAFIFEILSKRNLNLPDRLEGGKLSNWFWVKSTAQIK
ncbi:MAG: hypothetical protein ABL930_12205 [Pseudobdellovibrio sp.]